MALAVRIKAELIVAFHLTIKITSSSGWQSAASLWCRNRRPRTTLAESDMDRLKGIESFVCSALVGSFAAAAKQLRLSRAMISRRIFDLEEHLGVRLLHRTTQAGHATVEKRRTRAWHASERAERTDSDHGRALLWPPPHVRGDRPLFDAVSRHPHPDGVGARNPHPITLDEFGFDLGIAIGRTVQSDAVMHKIASFVWVI